MKLIEKLNKHLPKLNHKLGKLSHRAGTWDLMPAIRVKIDDGAYLPVREHSTDAGADIFSPCCVVVPARGMATVRTGVHVELPKNTVAMLKSKSGLNVKRNIIGEGVIDEGYDGEIVVKLYNLGDIPVRIPSGKKLIQMVILPVLYPTYVESKEIIGGERGSNGFGSTGE